ncbi:MAG TPA: GTPase [Thermodesulfobacteriota bacterium]|nr:GTPase [Thermodesulfobacteriota bacterium]
MPANLPPQYKDAEERYRQARTTAEKILALEEMLAIIPHHKGTDKLIAQLRKRLSQHKEETQRRPSASRQADPFSVKKEGAAQVALVGLPNCGKSQILAVLTNALPLIADYPFTTRAPLPGMMTFENVRIQLVDTPPLMDEFSETGLFTVIRNADALAVVLDLAEDCAAQVDLILEELDRHRVHLLKRGEERRKEIGRYFKRALLAGNRSDLKEARGNCRVLLEKYSGDYPALCVSAAENVNLDELKKDIFGITDIVRAYTKAPGKNPDLSDPVVLPVGSRVIDFAAHIHKDFAQKLKFARIWGREKYDGQMVQRDYVLQDGDVIELHT